MSRKATIIGTTRDHFGDPWELREWIETEHAFSIARGWPAAQLRGRGGVGGPRIVLTTGLVEHLEGVRYELNPTRSANLPLGRAQMKRIRQLLGHDRKADRRSWWLDRSDELASISFVDFGRKHGVSDAAAALMFESIFGEGRGRKLAWWKDDRVASLLLSSLPSSLVAEKLGRTIKMIWGARWLAKQGKR
jgi:hypothetical protein